MDQLVADFIFKIGLTLSVAILVAVSAGRMIHQINIGTMNVDKSGKIRYNIKE